jgi:hypothetical protein
VRLRSSIQTDMCIKCVCLTIGGVPNMPQLRSTLAQHLPKKFICTYNRFASLLIKIKYIPDLVHKDSCIARDCALFNALQNGHLRFGKDRVEHTELKNSIFQLLKIILIINI